MTDTPDNHASGPAYCPSCERFIGPVDTCPYCDADSAQPRAMRWLRWGAVAFGVLGVAILVLTARYREIPRVELGGVRPAMQFARVRMAGVVERNAFVGERNGQVDYLSFALVDGTQSVRVAAYDEVAVALVRARQIPKAGERVRAEGSLVTGRDGRMRLRLDSPAGIAIEAPAVTNAERSTEAEEKLRNARNARKTESPSEGGESRGM